jgi:hypothetical protein
MNSVNSVTDAPRTAQVHRDVTTEAISAVEAIVKGKSQREQ